MDGFKDSKKSKSHGNKPAHASKARRHDPSAHDPSFQEQVKKVRD
jgi:hypothetical protein